MASFQRSNQRQAVFSPRAITFLKGALHSRTAPTSFTVEVPKAFRPIGALLTAVPGGLTGGIAVSATLLPPASGPYSACNHPRLQIALTGTGAVAGDGDLMVIEV